LATIMRWPARQIYGKFRDKKEKLWKVIVSEI